jgi:hypothetical protein
MDVTTGHTVIVDGQVYAFQLRTIEPGGRLIVVAPGVAPFRATSLDDAEDKLRSVYTGGESMNANELTTPAVACCRYKGVNSRGLGSVGELSVSPGHLAWSLYTRGWRELTVTRDGVEVGGIGSDPDSGHRRWWGEEANDERR